MDADGQVLRDPAAVLQHFHALYEEKFRAPASEAPAASHILDEAEEVLGGAENSMLCQHAVCAEEVLTAVSKSPRRKSPGPDGITGEFYRAVRPSSPSLTPCWSSAQSPRR